MNNPRIYKTDGSVVEYTVKNGKFLTKAEIQKIVGVGGIGFYKLPIHHKVTESISRIVIVSKSQKGKRHNSGAGNIYGLSVDGIQGNCIVTDVRWLEKSPV